MEFLRDRQHDQQENREIEGIQGPAEPGGRPGQPLLLGRFLPPRDGLTDIDSDRHGYGPPVSNSSLGGPLYEVYPNSAPPSTWSLGSRAVGTLDKKASPDHVG